MYDDEVDEVGLYIMFVELVDEVDDEFCIVHHIMYVYEVMMLWFEREEGKIVMVYDYNDEIHIFVMVDEIYYVLLDEYEVTHPDVIVMCELDERDDVYLIIEHFYIDDVVDERETLRDEVEVHLVYEKVDFNVRIEVFDERDEIEFI